MTSDSTMPRRTVLAATGAAGAGLVLGTEANATPAALLSETQLQLVLRIARLGAASMAPVEDLGEAQASTAHATRDRVLSLAANLSTERLTLVRKAADSLSTSRDQALLKAMVSKASNDGILALVALAAATATPVVEPTADDLAAVWLATVGRIADSEKGGR